MAFSTDHPHSDVRIEREIARERQQRIHNDEARVGQGSLEEGRSKDARETVDSGVLRRQRDA